MLLLFQRIQVLVVFVQNRIDDFEKQRRIIGNQGHCRVGEGQGRGFFDDGKLVIRFEAVDMMIRMEENIGCYPGANSEPAIPL